jgi:hypothetical protein
LTLSCSRALALFCFLAIDHEAVWMLRMPPTKSRLQISLSLRHSPAGLEED